MTLHSPSPSPEEKTRQLSTLIELSALVTSSLDTAEITRHAIEAAITLLETKACSLLLLDEGTSELFFEVAVGEKSDIPREIRIPPGHGIAGWVARHGIPQLVSDVSADPRFYGGVDASSGFVTREIACVPVRFKEKMLGVMEAVNKIDGRLTNDDLEVLQALANHVAVALENARLFRENTLQYETLLDRERTHHREKEKLVKDLHDGIGGLTTNINLLGELGRKTFSLQEASNLFATIVELSREGMGEIRTFMNSLEDRDATWADLAAEFRRHGMSMLDPHGIAFSLSSHLEFPDDLPGLFLYLSLFRIYKEALANVVKHAEATEVSVALTAAAGRVILIVTDNGAGIGENRPKGRGISNMRSRAADLGGILSFDVSSGTVVRLEIPIPLAGGISAAEGS